MSSIRTNKQTTTTKNTFLEWKLSVCVRVRFRHSLLFHHSEQNGKINLNICAITMQKCFESLNIIQHLSLVCAPKNKMIFLWELLVNGVFASRGVVKGFYHWLLCLYHLFLLLIVSLCVSLCLASRTYTIHSLICSRTKYFHLRFKCCCCCCSLPPYPQFNVYLSFEHVFQLYAFLLLASYMHKYYVHAEKQRKPWRVREKKPWITQISLRACSW